MTDTNVLTLPWIDVYDTEYGASRVGLRALFTDAHRLRLLIQPDEATVITRFLTAVWAASGAAPATRDAWAEMWRAGRLPVDEIVTYLDAWEDRFDLNDEARPFYQHPDADHANRGPAALRIGQQATRGTRAMGWDGEIARTHWTAADAIPRLLRGQGMDTHGIKPAPPGTPGGKTFGAVTGPAGATTHLLPDTATVAHTMLLCLPPYTRADGDAPAWEWDDPDPAGISERPVMGMLDWLTWQARTMRLHITDSTVTAVTWYDGPRANNPPTSPAWLADPHATWYTSPNTHRPTPMRVDESPSTIDTAAQLIPWTNSDPDLANIALIDSTSTQSTVRDHLLNVADIIGGDTFNLDVSRVTWGTKSVVIDDVANLDQPLPMTGTVLSCPDRRAIIGIVTNAYRQLPHAAARAMRKQGTTAAETLANQAPAIDVTPAQWTRLITALSTSDRGQWETVAIAIINDGHRSISDWVDNYSRTSDRNRHEMVNRAQLFTGWTRKVFTKAIRHRTEMLGNHHDQHPLRCLPSLHQ